MQFSWPMIKIEEMTNFFCVYCVTKHTLKPVWIFILLVGRFFYRNFLKKETKKTIKKIFQHKKRLDMIFGNDNITICF